MKLFQKLLVAPATLGLLTPLSANATAVNLNEISNYSDVETIEFDNSLNNDSTVNSLLAGGEGLVDDSSYDGSFSETTTASFSANFYIGATETDDGSTTANDLDDAVMAGYDFGIGLTTSFTGEDSLAITIDSGNAGGSGYAEFGGDDTTDALTVDGVSYSFPVGGATVMVADNTDGSALFTTACTYGGPSDTLDDCGNVNAAFAYGGVMVGSSYDFGNGFTAAVGYAGPEGAVLTEESMDGFGINVAYTGDDYGLSVTVSDVETSIVQTETYTAINGYYAPEGLPGSVSIGYEVGEKHGALPEVDETESFFLGVTLDEVGPGSAGIAMGHSTTEGDTEEYMYEVYYDYPVNDGMTITPLVFIKEISAAGKDDTTGAMVKTSFSF